MVPSLFEKERCAPDKFEGLYCEPLHVNLDVLFTCQIQAPINQHDLVEIFTFYAFTPYTMHAPKFLLYHPQRG